MRQAYVGAILVLASCKSQRLSDAEALELETCNCPHADYACVNAVRDKYGDGAGVAIAWYERTPEYTIIEQHEKAAKKCRGQVFACGGAAGECGSGYLCTTGFCQPILRQGDACGGLFGGACGDGLYCKEEDDDPFSFKQNCDPGPCMGPTGTCERVEGRK